MFKKISSMLLIIAMLFTGSVFCNAEAIVPPDADTVQPMYTYTNNFKVTLDISNGTATYKTTLNGYSNVTKINCKITLQKKGLILWSDVTKRDVTHYGTVFSVTTTANVSSGKYRVKAVFTVYSGTNTEEITVYSASVSY